MFTAWLALEVSGTTSLISSSQACCRQSIKSVFIWPVDVVRLSSRVTKSSTMISPSSRSWVMLLTDSCPKPHFWKTLVIVFVDTSLQATSNNELLLQCFWGSLAFVSSSNQIFCYSFPVLTFKCSDYAIFKWLQARSCTFWQKDHLNVFKNIFECFRVTRCVIEKEYDLSRKRMIFLHSSWTLRSRSLSTSSIISVLI